MTPTKLPPTTILKALIVAEWSLLVVYLLSSIVCSLPRPLQEWVDYVEMSNGEILATFIIFLAFISYIAGSIGLFRLKRWGIGFYLVSILISLIFSPFTAPTIEHALPTTITYIANMAQGAVIALLFLKAPIK